MTQGLIFSKNRTKIVLDHKLLPRSPTMAFSDRNDCGDLYHSLKYSYNYHMDDCDEIMTLGSAGVSHMSIFNDFDETGRNELYGRIIDQFSMITKDSAPAHNKGHTLGTGTNDLGNDTRAHATLYSGQVEGACGLFGNSIDTGNIAANISGSNCDHIYRVEDNYFLIVTISPVLMMNYFLIVTLRRMLRMKLILIVTQRRRLIMKLVLTVTPVWLVMNLLKWVVKTQYLWMLLNMIIHVSH